MVCKIERDHFDVYKKLALRFLWEIFKTSHAFLKPSCTLFASPSEFGGLIWSYLVLIPHCMEYTGHYKLWWAWMFHHKTNCIQVIHERIPRTTTKFLGLTPVVSETEPDMLARVLFASKLETWQKNCTPLWYEVKHATIMTQSCKICHSLLSTLCMWTCIFVLSTLL